VEFACRDEKKGVVGMGEARIGFGEAEKGVARREERDHLMPPGVLSIVEMRMLNLEAMIGLAIHPVLDSATSQPGGQRMLISLSEDRV
jgi:hypothetical protein